MSRRSHVVRSVQVAKIGATRSLGGADILCSTTPGGGPASVNPDSPAYLKLLELPVESATNYRRCQVTATVAQFDAYDWVAYWAGQGVDPAPSIGEARVYAEIQDGQGHRIAAISVAVGCGGALGGVCDLPEGTTTFQLFATPRFERGNEYFAWDYEYWPFMWQRASLQGIRCQTVVVPACQEGAPE